MLLIVGCVLSCLNVVFFFLLNQNGGKRNLCNRMTAWAELYGHKVRGAWVRWFRYVQTRDS